ncbi:MAG: hypothetical protein ABEJ02_03000 [Candidatus Paceibacteria bacterium]
MADLVVILPNELEENFQDEEERTGRNKSEVTRAALEEYFMRRGLL